MRGELGENMGGEDQMTVVWSISKIISWNLGWRYIIVCNTSVKMIFPPAAHIGGITQHWLVLANFGHWRSTKVHEVVTLWVWEMTRFQKREKVPLEVLYNVQKCFSPGGPHRGISQILSPIFETSPHVDRQGKTIFELCRGPLEVPSDVSHT